MISLHQVEVIGRGRVSITINNGSIRRVGPADDAARQTPGLQIDCSDCLGFPGLINSHDHLHFNLFPQLGNRIYADYTEWGRDIHAVNRQEIDAVLRIPKPLRTQWGIYKNLLNGVTTVMHHGEYLAILEPIIAVHQECHMLHSVRLEKNWRWKLNQPFARPWPYAIHVGEGTNAGAAGEIDTLLRWNLCKRRLIGIHGVAMTERQAGAFAALVWCPDSNYFLLGRTADIPRLRKKTAILFGTDSTLSAGWDLWRQLRLARKLGMLPDAELHQAVTGSAAQIWNLPGRGRLEAGCQADIAVAHSRTGARDYAGWLAIEPRDLALVMQNGVIRLADEARHRQLMKGGYADGGFHKVLVDGALKFVAGDLPGLMAEIKRYSPETVFPVEPAE